nr:MAG TPA: P-loop Nucleotide Kinase3 [Caudoviricetes sp.]
MRSVYVIGPAGSGKSSLVQEILDGGGYTLGPNRLLHTYTGLRLGKPVPVTMTGHAMMRDGQPVGEYLGVMRDQFPGTDGLTANCGMVATDWVMRGGSPIILAEGSKLGTRRFLAALDVCTDALIVSLDASDEELKRRRDSRPEKTTEDNALRTAVRCRNLTQELEDRGYNVLRVNSKDVVEWKAARGRCIMWLEK